jgi:phosphatidate cytidylyltransferase
MTATVFDTAPYVAGALGAGGVGVWLSGKRELVARWCTWAVTAPLVGGLLLLGAPGAALLAAGLGVVAAWEYARLVGLAPADRALLAGAAITAPVLAWLAPGSLARLALVVPAVAALPALLGGDVRTGGRRAAYAAFGLLWLAALSQLVGLGRGAFALCLAVSVADVTAWCGGRLLGGARFSRVSPNKTVGGLVGGALGGTAVLALLGAATPALVVAVSLGGVAGDLLESLLKREAGVKDAGAWLPGFGGLLDRIDSLLVALAVAGALS